MLQTAASWCHLTLFPACLWHGTGRTFHLPTLGPGPRCQGGGRGVETVPMGVPSSGPATLCLGELSSYCVHTRTASSLQAPPGFPLRRLQNPHRAELAEACPPFLVPLEPSPVNAAGCHRFGPEDGAP